MKILGREPALVIGVVVALISLAGTLGFSFINGDQAALWITGVNAVAAGVMAWTVRPLQPGVYTYAVGAIVALATGYGLNFTDVQVNAINGLVVPALALLTRNQVSPIATAITKSSNDPTIEAAKAEGKAVDTGGPVETTA